MQRTESQAALPSHLKGMNRQKILRVIQTGRVLTVADIHTETSISRPTITRAVQDYLRQGVLRSVGYGSTTSMGGKKPELFCFADERKILCINLWPDTITLSLSGLIGDVYDLKRIPYQMGGSLTDAFGTVRTLAQDYLEAHHLIPDNLYGVVLSVPGTVDYPTRTLRYNSQAPGWGTNVNLAGHLRDIFGDKPVYLIDNAGKAAGRALLMERPQYADIRLMTLFTSWGVSACMIERGHILNGRDSLIGEIGHMVISEGSADLCGCGKRGCLEGQVSIRRVRQMMQELGAEGDLENLSYLGLFARSREGDAIAREVVRHLARSFASALHNLSLAYDQDAVVFQGAFAWADEVFDACMQEELRQFRYYPEGQLFSIDYDRRDLAQLAAQGGAELIKRQYFSALAED